MLIIATVLFTRYQAAVVTTLYHYGFICLQPPWMDLLT